MKRIQFSVFKNYPIPFTENDKKLQSLFIYIESLLSDTLDEIKKNKQKNKTEIFEKEIKESIIDFDMKLIEDIRELCPTLKEIEKERNIVFEKRNPNSLDIILLSEGEPFKNIYNIIANTCESEIGHNSRWIPDLLSIALINNWKTEHEKLSLTYIEILNKDYQSVLDKYNQIASLKSKSKKDEDLRVAQTIKKMYSTADRVTEELNKAKYKTIMQVKNNTSKRKKKRKRK